MGRLDINTKLRVISVVLQDHPGALFRVTGLIRRRGFNIDTLAVGPSERPGFSRMTLTVDAGRAHADQVAKQIRRLEDVLEVSDITDDHRVEREMALLQLRLPAGTDRQAALSAVFALECARVVEESENVLVVEITGFFDVVEAAIQSLSAYNITELCRSGPLAIRKEVAVS
jgi:acetolactate synthase-1/3 small subunit